MKTFFNMMVLAVMLCIGSISANASVEGAQAFIKNVGDITINTVKSEKLSVDQKETKLIDLFEDSVDTAWIAKFVMGRYWRETEDDQREKYKRLYHKYLLQSYVPKFKTYTNEKIDFVGSKEEFDKEYIVNTEIIDADGQEYRVDYKVRESTDGSYKIFDIIAEGISLITTQRSEFGSILSRKGADFLIEKLEQKTAKKASL